MADADAVAYPDTLPVVDYEKQHQSVMAALGAIYDEVAMNGWEILAFLTTAAAQSTIQSQWPKARVKQLLVGSSGTAGITLNIGSAAYQLRSANSGMAALPFPIVIERGVDMSITSDAAVNVVVYLIGVPE